MAYRPNYIGFHNKAEVCVSFSTPGSHQSTIPLICLPSVSPLYQCIRHDFFSSKNRNHVHASVGVWSSYIGEMAGVKVPLIAMKHAYVVSEKIDDIQNMPNVRDHDASVYLRLQGDALCIGGYEPNPIFWEQVV